MDSCSNPINLNNNTSMVDSNLNSNWSPRIQLQTICPLDICKVSLTIPILPETNKFTIHSKSKHVKNILIILNGINRKRESSPVLLVPLRQFGAKNVIWIKHIMHWTARVTLQPWWIVSSLHRSYYGLSPPTRVDHPFTMDSWTLDRTGSRRISLASSKLLPVVARTGLRWEPPTNPLPSPPSPSAEEGA